MVDVAAVAAEVLDGLDAARQVQPFTDRIEGFDAAAAYRITAELRRLRVERGERQIGRKIGFTNRNIWPEYGVYEPIWGDVYATTVVDVAPSDSVRISHLPQPRIEPEIILGLDTDVVGTPSLEVIASRIGWIAHGFEIVQSIYPAWRCSVADCVADNGLHGALFIGLKRVVPESERMALVDQLPRMRIDLYRNGQHVDGGVGANVLDGPVQALAYLTRVLAADPVNPPLRAGEFVSTGTITRAFPVAPGEQWSTRLAGFDLPGMDLVLY